MATTHKNNECFGKPIVCRISRRFVTCIDDGPFEHRKINFINFAKIREIMATDLTKLKCRNCEKLRFFHAVTMCFETKIYCDPSQPACISVSPKLSARERRECLTK